MVNCYHARIYTKIISIDRIRVELLLTSSTCSLAATTVLPGYDKIYDQCVPSSFYELYVPDRACFLIVIIPTFLVWFTECDVLLRLSLSLAPSDDHCLPPKLSSTVSILSCGLRSSEISGSLRELEDVCQRRYRVQGRPTDIGT